MNLVQKFLIATRFYCQSHYWKKKCSLKDVSFDKLQIMFLIDIVWIYYFTTPDSLVGSTVKELSDKTMPSMSWNMQTISNNSEHFIRLFDKHSFINPYLQLPVWLNIKFYHKLHDYYSISLLFVTVINSKQWQPEYTCTVTLI